MRDERAERAILSHAEAYRLVVECQEQRARADAAEARLAELLAALQGPWTVHVGTARPERYYTVDAEAVERLRAPRGEEER